MAESGSEIFINSQGEWWYEGSKIVHPEVLNLFKRSLTIDNANDEFYVDYKGQRAPVKVATTPYFIRDAVIEKDQEGDLLDVMLEVDDGTRESLNPQSLKLNDKGVLEGTIKSGRFRASCLPAAHFRLAELLEEDGAGGFFIVINHEKFSVGNVSE